MKQPQLIVKNGFMAGRVYPLQGDVITIGRAADNTIALEHELKVSAHHARILARIGLFWVEDLKSTNGTFLEAPGSERFRLEVGKPVLLVDGASLCLANTVTLEAHGLIASQDEATARALARLQSFVTVCYEQMARLSARERQQIEERLQQFEQSISQATSEADLVRLVAEQLDDLSRTVVCTLEDTLPDFPEGVPEPGQPSPLPSLNNLFLSQLEKLKGGEG
ncbi:MAG: hypothetical protein Fur0043_23540 [Anaerolineales bacterium]